MTKTEGKFTTLLHLLGTLFSIAALSLMVVFASLRGTPLHIVSVSLFGATLLVLYLAGTFKQFKLTQRPWDEALIYLFFAGSTTPILLSLPDPNWAWALFGVVWGLGLIGFVLTLFSPKIPRWLWWAFYGLVAAYMIVTWIPMYAFLSKETLIWMGLGDTAYRLAAFFYLLNEHFPHRAPKKFSWHHLHLLLFLLGSFSYFWISLETLY